MIKFEISFDQMCGAVVIALVVFIVLNITSCATKDFQNKPSHTADAMMKQREAK